MSEDTLHLGYCHPADGPVPNPGMGLLGYVYSDHMHVGIGAREWLRTETEENNRALDRESFEEFIRLPHIHNLYLRFDWRDLHAASGKLLIPEALRWALEAVEERQLPFSLRIMNHCPHSPHDISVPEFLRQRLDFTDYWKLDIPPNPKRYPAYNEEYFKWWGEILHLLADRFDSHPLLEFVDISGVGHWGEGHHWASYDGFDSAPRNPEPDNIDEAIDRAISLHLEAFTQTPAAINLHYTDYPSGLRHYQQNDLWLRRDSFMPHFSASEWERIVGLPLGRAMMWEPYPSPGLGAEPAVSRIIDSKSCYTSLGFNPWDAIIAHRQMTPIVERLAETLGYRIRPSIVWRRFDQRTGNQTISLALLNDGIAALPGALSIKAEFPSGASSEAKLPKGEPAPGSRPSVHLPVPASDLLADRGSQVRLTLSIRLSQKTRPVRWAAKEAKDSGYSLSFPFYQPGQNIVNPEAPYILGDA